MIHVDLMNDRSGCAPSGIEVEHQAEGWMLLGIDGTEIDPCGVQV